MQKLRSKVFVQNESGRPIEKANRGDVGYDLFAVSEPEIVGKSCHLFDPEHSEYQGKVFNSVNYIEYRTGVRLELPENIYALIYPRSSVSKKNLQLCNSVGVIDSGYRGEIIVRFNYICDPEDYIIRGREDMSLAFCHVPEEKIYGKGDKICQIVFREHLSAKDDFVLIEKSEISEETERGSGGFGSTGE